MPETPPSGLTDTAYLTEVLRAPVYEAAAQTPLQKMPLLSRRLGCTVLVKREDRQRVHSFKSRGAYNRMRSLTDDEQAAGVVAASAGNHAQGVALAARLLDVPATVVMPTPTATIKVNAVRARGAEVVLRGSTFDEAKAEARRLADEQGLTFIAPFDDPLVIAGQGTIGLELVQQDAHLDRVFVPIGGGGLAAGVALVVKQLLPDVQVIGVEPDDAASMTAAIAAGEPVELPTIGGFAEGVAVKRVGDETFSLCRRLLDDVVTVDSDSISAAIKDIFEDVRAIAEPAGALALAGLKQYAADHDVRGERLAHVLSGANMNFHGLRYVSERAEIGEQREALFGVTIPERRGAFLDFCRLVDGRMVTEFNYRVQETDDARIFVGLQLREGISERSDIMCELTAGGYDVVDLSDDEVAKTHVRYMVGGRPRAALHERVLTFEFPEHPGALMRFLQTLGTRWNITAFHYRSHGMDYGRVLASFQDVHDEAELASYLDDLGYTHAEVTDSPAFRYFLG